jgi:hypothetical protein
VRRSLAAACALSCGASFAAAASGSAEERGLLISVQAGGDAAASSIELTGDRPLSFTTLRLHGPPRVVVDFADTAIALAEREVQVDDGTIRRVAAAPAGQKTARVVIELEGEAEFDVRAHGNRVEVRVPRIAPLLAKAEPESAPAGADRGTASPPSAEADRGTASPPNAEADRGTAPAPAAEADRGASAETGRGVPGSTSAEAGRAGAAAPGDRSAAAAQSAVAGTEASPAPSAVAGAKTSPAPSAPVISGEQATPAPGAAPEAAQSAGAPSSAAATEAELQKRASLPTVALGGSRAPAPFPESAAAKKRRELDERIAAYAEAQREAAEKSLATRKATKERNLAAAQTAADEKRAAAGNAAAAKKARALEAAEGSADARRAAEAKNAETLRPTGRKIALAGPGHAITGIGFRPVGDGEVIVRSDRPLEYGVTGADNAILLHLPGAAITLQNNRRPLDTRFFNGPVQRVVPLAVEGGTDLRIELRAGTGYRLAQAGDVLTVTFSAPR